jgi:hypothetical protein
MFNSFPKIPQFNLACGNNKFKEVMHYVYLGKNYTVATNAHILMWVKNDYPDELQKFIDKKGEVFIHKDQWKKISKIKTEDLFFLSVDTHAIVFKAKGKKIFVEYTTSPPSKYPQWQSVLPVDIETGENHIEPQNINAIGINPRFLYNIQMALHEEEALYTYFYGTNRTILVRQPSTYTDIAINQGAIIMPVLMSPQ